MLVVEDSLTVRKYLVECLSADPELEVIAEAEDGKQAIELCERLRPDVITVDMMLPVMTGLSVTEYVMAYCPTPILIVSASTNRGELFRTYDALAAGALDVIEKPLDVRGQSGMGTEADFHREARVACAGHHARPRALGRGTHATGGSPARPQPMTARHQFVAISASTGGPQRSRLFSARFRRTSRCRFCL